ncbi:MAG: thermonuclease family protein [Candidatus Methanofastidiosia archaeon]|jgi:micrococcal nuclease
MRSKPFFVLAVVITITSCITPSETTVLSVIDGDTFVIESEQVVRLIGIDAPELSEPGGEAAKEYLSSLILHQYITLVSGDTNKDAYGRLLRYVYTGKTCINEKMIKDGYAEARYLFPDHRYHDHYYTLEIEAESHNRGLWKLSIFQPRTITWDENIPVIFWEDAKNYYNQNVIIHGTVTRTYRSKEVIYLHFSSDKNFKAVIFAFDFSQFPKSPHIYYQKQTVQILGIIQSHNDTPIIIVKTPEQIRIL